MTWEQLIAYAAARLDNAGVDDARINAEYLATHALGLSEKSQLRWQLSKKIRYDHAVAFAECMFLREHREPLQYILGEWEFYGLPVKVNRGVLIPRPETEILVEEALKEAILFGDELRILDIGTGSGAIALALASRLPRADVVGIDIRNDSVDLARQNAQDLNLANVRFRIADVMSGMWPRPHTSTFDLIVSNPPYVTLDDFATLDPELRLYEPRVALTDESDGLRFYRRIAEIMPRLLAKPSGRLLLEIGYGQASPVSQIIVDAKLQVLRIVDDLSGIPRVIVVGW